jgi:hypothetical protein
LVLSTFGRHHHLLMKVGEETSSQSFVFRSGTTVPVAER